MLKLINFNQIELVQIKRKDIINKKILNILITLAATPPYRVSNPRLILLRSIASKKKPPALTPPCRASLVQLYSSQHFSLCEIVGMHLQPHFFSLLSSLPFLENPARIKHTNPFFFFLIILQTQKGGG